MKLLVKSALNDENLIAANNSNVIPVAVCTMNDCKMTKYELSEMDKIMKRELMLNKVLGRKAGDERLYLKTEHADLNLREMYKGKSKS